MATPARFSQEIIAARHMLERAKERFGLQPVSVAADKNYGTDGLKGSSSRPAARSVKI
jgi:hypothetical protein